MKFNSFLYHLHYKAPEVLKDDMETEDERSDIWSIGILMYVLLTGMIPFDGANDQEIKENIIEGKIDYDSDCLKSVSNTAKSLLKKLLHVDVKKRSYAV